MNSKHKKTSPPRLGRWLLESFCSYDFLSTALWDLEELFDENVKSKGAHKARLLYLREAFSIVIYLFFKGKSQYSTNKTAMFKHNILIAFRSFKRFKSTFIINLIGLASGLACTLLIYLWVADELSMDMFHENSSQIYQVLQNAETTNGIMTFEYTPALLAKTLQERYPEVVASTSVLPSEPSQSTSFAIANNNYFDIREQFIDDEFFEVFTYSMTTGNSQTIFDQPDNILISKHLAARLFNEPNKAVGQSIRIQTPVIDADFLIGGVFEDVPVNSTLQFDVLFNIQKYIEYGPKNYLNWNNNNPNTYSLVKKGTDIAAFNDKIYALVETFDPKASAKLFAQKFHKRHLNGLYEEGKVAGGRIAYVRLFSLVAMVILVIACINFMNLSTAKANTRLKELGVKKALGAHRKTLVQQYYTEALLMTFLASVVALIVALGILPYFNQLTGKQLSFELNQTILLGFLSIIGATTLLSGSYPALYLSRLKTLASLRGQLQGGFGDLWARKGLVIFQFGVSIILIVSVLVVSNQISFIQSKNLGYNRDNVVFIANSGVSTNEYNAFQQSIKSIPGVLQSSSAAHNLTGDYGRTSGMSWPGRTPDQRLTFLNLETSIGFIETMGVEVIEGRSVEEGRPNEFNKILLNETAVKQMKLENPVGQTVKLWGRDKVIIGIVKDFHVETLYEAIDPTIIHPVDEHLNQTFIKIKAGTELQTITQLEKVFEEFSNGQPFELGFVDESYRAMYKSERQVASLSKSFAIVAIIISCLGLLGLTSFTAQMRAKEIGIRKVLGAEVWRIVYLLSGDFSKMVLAAIVISLPISYFIVKAWIQNFAFSVELSPLYFVLAAVIIFSIAWLTVGLQTLKAASVNPVDSLKNE